MKKEVGQKQDQRLLSQTMRELEVKNAEYGGMLFATFGEGDSRFFVFPTPATIQREGIPVGRSGHEEEILSTETTELFLVIAGDGFMAIQVDYSNYCSIITNRHRTIGEDGFSIARIVEDQIGRKDGFFNSSGYKNGNLKIADRLNITSDGTSYLGRRRIFGELDSNTRCRLVYLDEAKVEKILDENLKRVEAERATSQKVSQALSTFS